MKRKLSTSIKGTQLITKFFKRSSDIRDKNNTVVFRSSNVPKSKTNCDSQITRHSTAQECKENISPVVDDKSDSQLKCCVVKVELFRTENGCIEKGNNDQTDATKTLKTSEVPILAEKDTSASFSSKESLTTFKVPTLEEKDESTSLPKEILATSQLAVLEEKDVSTSLSKESSTTSELSTLEEKDESTTWSIKSLTNRIKTKSSCEENQELVRLSSNKDVHTSVSPSSGEITPYGIQGTVNCADIFSSFDAKMEDVTGMEISDFQTINVSEEKENANEQKLVSSEVNAERDHEATVIPRNAGTEGNNLSTGKIFEDNEDDEDESDDELLCPPAFLCDYRVKPEIRTPEKGTVPLTGSPLTPGSPFVEQQKNDRVICRYSLAKLVLEKPKQVKKDQEIARLQSAIHEQIEKGRMARLAGDPTTESEDDDETILPNHQKELDKFISKDKVFAEEIPGEDIFPELKKPIKHENGCSQPFPTLNSTGVDEFTDSLSRRSDVEIQELLCGGWITQRYLVRPCPQTVVQWLFHILSYHLDNHTVQASYNCLWSLWNAESTKGGLTRLSWMPSIQDILLVLYSHGANVTSLSPKTGDEMDSSVNSVTSTIEEGRSSVTLEGTQDYSSFPFVNLTRLIQFITLCFVQSPGHYTTENLERLVVSLFCLSLDGRMDLCLHDIKTCLEAAYDAFQQNQWPDEAIKLSAIISQRKTHHRNKLHMVQMQPYSCRGRDIKRLACMQTLASLAADSMGADEVKDVIRSDVRERKDKEVIDTMKSFEKLEKLLHQLRVNNGTDYYKVYTIIELLDLAVGAEPLLPPEKIMLERITSRLRILNGDIKDPRAMFISRTKVKDLILRTVSKFAFMTQGKKETQKSISGIFEDAKSDLFIETLQETEEPDENVESDAEKSVGYSSDLGSFSPISDALDESEDTSKSTSDLP